MGNKEIQEQWDEIPYKGLLPAEVKSRMWMNIHRETLAKRRKRAYQWVAAACAILLLSVGGYESFFSRPAPVVAMVATKTFPQDIRLLRLPDGTRVWVNQNTEIEYPREFNGTVRSVTLKGEAFFEVAKDASKPFVIISGTIKTTVLGTSFNVKAYAGRAPEVCVRTGKVKVEGKENTVLLQRGDAVVYLAAGNRLQKQKAILLEPEWKKSLLDINGLTLQEVVNELKLHHNFVVTYTGEDMKLLKIRGTLDTRQGLHEMLQTIAFALELKISPTGNNTYIISK